MSSTPLPPKMDRWCLSKTSLYDDPALEARKCEEAGKYEACLYNCYHYYCINAREEQKIKTEAKPKTKTKAEPKKSFFSLQDVAKLETHRYNRFHILRSEYIIWGAVEHWYTVCMEKRDIILKGIIDEIDKPSQVCNFTSNDILSHAFTFSSSMTGRLDPSEAPHISEFSSYGGRHDMWYIYRHTDFCKKLLERLELDPAKLSFKNVSNIGDPNQKVVENMVYLVFKRFKKN